ncbi:CHAP domain-containing protein [Moheibacter lacus]|uniref:CHAP domain-containing protein n=1 Tax=Moheibacter lacus TaxID=2745851 RepID=A0A838ZS35_9FLAO|nr:CHAP domain-containing protein [Moheibacter lacus]MBA5629882.1 CHAP domain-containing protein [Moheibacter lacus]
MKYPKRLIKKGERDQKVVEAIQKQLNKLHCGPIEVDGDFGNQTFKAVKLFQSRNTDINGIPLVVDGVVGAITWEVLFLDDSVPVAEEPTNALFKEVLKIANSQLHVRENPRNSNRGKEVDAYLKAAGLDAHRGNYAWCMAFVYWVFEEACKNLGRSNPMVKTAGVLKQWNQTDCRKFKTKDVVNNPSLIKPGYVFIRNYGRGMGHTGIITAVKGGYIHTIEGNSNDNGTREGIGVFELTRKIKSIENGFIDFNNKA